MSTTDIIIKYFPAILRALPATLEMLIVTVIMAFILGFFLAWGKICKVKILRVISGVFISFQRGTPMMVQLLLVFILIPVICNNNGINIGDMDPIVYALVAFGLNLSAFFAEIYRSAYNSLDYKQIEAAQSLGESDVQVFFRVILPQGAANALPNFTNMSLEQMKNTSIASIIGVYDILGRVQQLVKNAYGVGQMQMYIMVGVIYWVMGLIILLFSNMIVKRLNKGNPEYAGNMQNKVASKGAM